MLKVAGKDLRYSLFCWSWVTVIVSSEPCEPFWRACAVLFMSFVLLLMIVDRSYEICRFKRLS